MNTFHIKNWIYKDIQTKANKYNWVICWEIIEIGCRFDDSFLVYGNIEKETEKAIYVSLDYWNKSIKKNGFKVWLPKSALINVY